MIYSNDKFQNDDISFMMGDPIFSSILAFSYYDGPETGLALSSSGMGFRFATLGDSASGLFRSFELHEIVGNWPDAIDALRADLRHSEFGRILFPGAASISLTKLENDVLSAEAINCYVCVASRQLEWMIIGKVTETELKFLRQLHGDKNRFKAIHRLVKMRGQKIGNCK